MQRSPVKVLIVDDSAFIRMLLSQILDSDSDIKVVATAEDPYDAREKIKKYNPDVITLDVEMPRMDGLTFLGNIMRLRPMPVVMVSTLTQAGADVTIRALELGAFDFVAKPVTEVKEQLTLLAQSLIDKVKAAAACNAVALETIPPGAKPLLNLEQSSDQVDLITIGASTGGTEAIHRVIERLPAKLPPIVMTQHIPDVFSTSYAKRLNDEVIINVQEVRSPQKLEFGHAYLAPGHQHMKIERHKNELWAVLSDAEPVNRHKPAVDVLFESVVASVGERCIGVLLTGMGQDGARGLLKIRKNGGLTCVQDEQTSVVWGMPGAAVKLDATNRVLPLSQIPGFLLDNL